MHIEMWRKFLPTDASRASCGICGNDFDLGTVFPVAFTKRREEIGEICPVCLDYLNRRKQDQGDPTLDNWPAREWPTPGDLERARRRHPEPMFPDDDAYHAAAPDLDTELLLLQSSMIWTTKGTRG